MSAQRSTPTSRLSAAEIFDRVERGAQDELDRPVHNLAFSAVSAGTAMGLSGLAVAGLRAAFGDGPAALSLSYLGYPLGFLVVILGRQQLFTENTLFPVALVLAQRSRLWLTLRLWGVVLAGNAVGATLFALLATQTPALSDGPLDQLVTLGTELGTRDFATVFWTGVVAGWIIALVAWLVTASTDTVGQLLVIFFLTFVVGVGQFSHSIAGMGELFTAVFAGELGAGSAFGWVVAAVLGNTAGGVVIVALFNYGQVHGADQR